MTYEIKHVAEEIYTIKDIIPVSYQNAIIDRMQGENFFPWFLLHKIGHKDYFTADQKDIYIDPNVTDDSGFFHIIQDDTEIRSAHYDFFRMILEFYCEKTGKTIDQIFRIRARYTSPSPGHDSTKYAAPHIDYPNNSDYTTLIYYVNDADGDTILFDKMFNPQTDVYNPVLNEKITEVYRHTPKKGEALIFNGHRYHSGNFPIKHSSRIVLNFDFLEY
jgi:hypothetical protein|tara:strand:+ start:5877 stop:6530 length:654 start_codon:yes stop_codon:yes gene_type:complete